MASADCADVLDAQLEPIGERVYRVTVTVRSTDTGWEKYADAWEVRSSAGKVLGERILLHPHVEEQPFTRSLEGVVIPEGIEEVTIAARDSVEGFCGAELQVSVPG